MKLLISLLIFFAGTWQTALGQQKYALLDNPAAMQKARQATQHLYNWQFAQATAQINGLAQMVPQHPVVPMLRALNLSWQHYPLQEGTPAHQQYMALCQEAKARGQALLEQDDMHLEGVFFTLVARSSIMQQHHADGSFFAAVSMAKRTYGLMKTGMTLTQANPEFLFSTGLYNYYRERFAQTNPFYKSFLWLFVEGNRPLGLKQLALARKQAVFTAADALHFLTHIYLHYEFDYAQALKMAQELSTQYANNLMYQSLWGEALLRNQQWQALGPVAQRLSQSQGAYYAMAGQVLQGHLWLQQGGGALPKAQQAFNKALQLGQDLTQKTGHFKSMAYYGLGQVAQRQGYAEQATKYYNQAVNVAEYDNTKEEARQALASLKQD